MFKCSWTIQIQELKLNLTSKTKKTQGTTEHVISKKKLKISHLPWF